MKNIMPFCSIIAAAARTVWVAGFAVLLTMFTLALPGAASASVIASDDFEAYAAGVTVVGDAGGVGWTGTWTQDGGGNPRATVIDTTGSPMSFTVPGGDIINGATRALEIQLTGSGSSQPAARRQLAVPLAQTFYVGYLVRYVPGNASATWAGGNNTFTMYLSDTSTDTSVLNFGLRGGVTPKQDFMMRFGNGGPPAGAYITNSVIATNQDYYLVCKMVWSGSAYTNAIMWTNPPVNGETLLPGGNASLGGFTQGAVNYLFWREASLDANDILRVDQLTVGTTWADVVPAGPAIPECSVETKADGTGTIVPLQTLTAGQSITMYAIARDENGNYVTNTPAYWSPVNATGGVAGSDIVPVGNGQSALFTAHLAGSANIKTTPPTGATNYINSGTLTVVAGPATTVRVETVPDGSGTLVPAQTLTPGSSVTSYAIYRDVGGNFLSNGVAIWSEQNVTGGIAGGDLVSAGDNKSAAFTGNLSGTATLQAFVSGLTPVNSGVLTVTRSVIWTGNSSALWNHIANNWTPDSGAAQTKFYDQDSVTFDGADSQPNVNLTDVVLPYIINITGGSYTIGGNGSIAGSGSLNLSSGGTVILTSSNSYAGPTTVSSGTLQLGNGVQNGSLGAGGSVRINTGADSINFGGTDSLIFNRTDSVAAPYLVTNTISGVADFCIDVNSGAVELTGAGADAHCNALVKSGATLLLGKNTVGGGAALGNNTALGTYVLNVNAGGKCMLASDVGDHITGAGKLLQIDGTFDANGHAEAFGILQGAGVLDNSGASNAVLTVNQGSSTFPGVGNGGEIYTWNGVIKSTGTGTLAITKDGTNTLILANADTYNGDPRIIGGGVLQLGNVNSMQGSSYNQASGDSGSLSFGDLTSATLGGLKGGTAPGLGLTNASGTAVALTIGGNGQTNTYSGVLSGPGSLTKTGTGIQTLSGTNTYSGHTTRSQGALLVNCALAGGSVTVASGAMLGGKGIIGGATTIQTGGTLAPGTPAPGILTVSAAVTLQTGSATVIQINRTNAVNSGRLTATTIALNGTLTVTNVGPALASGDTFTLFSGSLSGSINPASLPPLLNGLSWDTSALNTSGTIAVTSTVITTPPMISSVSVVGGNLTMIGSGGVPGGIYYVISD